MQREKGEKVKVLKVSEDMEGGRRKGEETWKRKQVHVGRIGRVPKEEEDTQICRYH